MLRKIVVYIITFLSLTKVIAQSTSSPYSVFAVGCIENYSFGTNQGMGGTGIGFKSDNWLNPINPASYDGIDSLRLIYEFGVFGKYTKYNDTYNNVSKKDANISYLALGLRVNRFWAASVGAVPVSSVGYTINSYQSIEGLLSKVNKTYSGSGGISKVYFGNAFTFFNHLSLGINYSYYFGKITRNEIMESNSYFNSYEVDKSYYVKNFSFDYGLQYQFNVKKTQYTLGLIYGNKRTLNATNDISLILSSDTITLKNEKTKFYIPSKYGIGFGIEHDNRLKAGIDYEVDDWSGITFANPLLETRKSERYSFGMEYLPQKSYADRGLRLVRYRLGLNYNKSYLIIDQTPINSKSVTVGFGIPLRKELSLVNVSFEFGENGTLKNHLIKEEYFMVHLNFTLRDKWFEKTKYY